jgi:integrase
MESRIDSMPLEIYRFHSADCRERLLAKGLSPKTFREYGQDDDHCQCLIYLTGRTENEYYPRRSTGLRDWAAAQALARTLDAKGKDAEVHGPTLEDCIQRFLDSKKRISKRAHGQFKLTLNRLKEYARKHNKMFIRELTVDLCENFIAYALDMQENSKATSGSKIKTFLNEAYRREWLLQPLAIKLKIPIAIYEPAEPFTEEEVEKILADALKLNGGVSAYAKHPKTLRLLLELMNETGMRCGDSVRYLPADCVKSDLMWKYVYIPQKSRRDKKPKPATVYITDRLKDAIDKCDWMSSKRPFAYLTVDLKNEDKDRTTYMSNEVYERMKSIGARCVDNDGRPQPIDDCRPHRFRDRFAVRLLERGMSVDDVSHLLNHHSISVTEKHYAKWVEARRKRLETVFFEATKN